MTTYKLVKDTDGYYLYRGVRISKTRGGWTFRRVTSVRHDCVVPDTLKNIVGLIDSYLNDTNNVVDSFRIVTMKVGA